MTDDKKASESKAESAKKEPPPLTSVPDFLLNAPLYKSFKLDDELNAIAQLAGKEDSEGGRLRNFDGHCPHCGKETTFTFREAISIPNGDPWKKVRDRHAFDRVTLECSRNSYHILWFWMRMSQMVITKVGQWPSVADIAINEVRNKYKAVLRGDNWSELYRAVGLAAHGEGIGAFVYLRRTIERLVRSRFDEFKKQEGWTDEEFDKRRMVEKIEYIGSHLPAYLVANRRIYGIFSVGIHELENDKCLEFYEIGMRTIVMILQEDLAKREELATKRQLQEAVAKFDPEAASAADDA